MADFPWKGKESIFKRLYCNTREGSNFLTPLLCQLPSCAAHNSRLLEASTCQLSVDQQEKKDTEMLIYTSAVRINNNKEKKKKKEKHENTKKQTLFATACKTIKIILLKVCNKSFCFYIMLN